MNLEKLYQDVWAQVFASAFLQYCEPDYGLSNNPQGRDAAAGNTAGLAAAAALKAWDPAKAHAAICAAQGLPKQEGE